MMQAISACNVLHDHCADLTAIVQLRDFLQQSLYDPEQGYFTAAGAKVPVGSVGTALPFPELAGEEGYRNALRKAYDNLEVCIIAPISI